MSKLRKGDVVIITGNCESAGSRKYTGEWAVVGNAVPRGRYECGTCEHEINIGGYDVGIWVTLSGRKGVFKKSWLAKI